MITFIKNIKHLFERSLYFKIIILISIFILIIILLKNRINYKTNLISKFNIDKISLIVLEPSNPKWKVNIIDKPLVINKTSDLESISKTLEKVTTFEPCHPIRTWEVNFKIINTERDTINMRIHKTNKNESIIYIEQSEWQNDSLGYILENITNYYEPKYGFTENENSQ
jgi:hypothetical protein